jgi:hypothetical protein
MAADSATISSNIIAATVVAGRIDGAAAKSATTHMSRKIMPPL